MGISISPASLTKSSEDWQRLQIATRLEIARRNPNDPADWARGYRLFDGRPMRLTPALQDLYRDSLHRIVIQKAAQVGVSEYLINAALWAAATRQGGRGNALYLMPTQVTMDDFVQGRVDRAIADSPHLATLVRPVKGKEKHPDRLRVKRVADGYVYFRGAESRRQVMTIDADLVLLDQLDSMDEWVLPAALNRLGSSTLAWIRAVSTPSIPEAGVNAIFLQSDQRHYFLPCPKCGLKQPLAWPDNVDIDKKMLVCTKCRAPLDIWAQGQWVPAKPSNSDWHGYHLSKLYSPMTSISQLVRASESVGVHEVQEFQRSDLGLVHVPEGGQLTLDDLDRCRRDYLMPDVSSSETVMGVDVGTKLHAVIREKAEKNQPTRAFSVDTVDGFHHLEALLDRYNVTHCVIDAQPEQKAVKEFQRNAVVNSTRLIRVHRSYYSARQEDYHWEGGREGTVHANRTMAIEEMLDCFQRQLNLLPKDARRLGGHVHGGLGEYYREMMALTRQLEQDSQGNWISRYSDGGKPDHFAHAEIYCMLAGHDARAGSGIWLPDLDPGS